MQTQNDKSDETKALENFAVLVIDVQQGLFMKSTPIYQADTLLTNIAMLVGKANAAEVPVIYVQHSDQMALIKGSPEWRLHPQLPPIEDDWIIHKLHGNAFEDTRLDELLKQKNIRSLVVLGLVTHGCVKATCLGARQLKYEVVLVKDGHSSYSQKAGQLIDEWNEKLVKQGVKLMSATEIAEYLARLC